jgi:predicted HTH transcriptional regulator
MLRLETKSDLQRLVDDEIPESLTLDYKKSPALAKDSASRDELCKDVSAFANSAGGRIIYGIPEKDQKPQPLDSGVPNDKISREWIRSLIRGCSRGSKVWLLLRFPLTRVTLATSSRSHKHRLALHIRHQTKSTISGRISSQYRWRITRYVTRYVAPRLLISL